MKDKVKEQSILAVCEYVSRLRIGGDNFLEIVDNLKSQQIDKVRFLNLKRCELIDMGLTDAAKRTKLYAHLHHLRQKQKLLKQREMEKWNNLKKKEDNSSRKGRDVSIKAISKPSSPRWVKKQKLFPNHSTNLTTNRKQRTIVNPLQREYSDSDSCTSSDTESATSPLNVPSPRRMSPMLMENYSEKIKRRMSPKSRELMCFIQQYGSQTTSDDMSHMNESNGSEDEKITSLRSISTLNFAQDFSQNSTVSIGNSMGYSSEHSIKNLTRNPPKPTNPTNPPNPPNLINPIDPTNRTGVRVTVTSPKSMRTEPFVYFRCVRASQDTAKFMGVLRHFNRRNQAFILMEEDHAKQFNATVEAWENQQHDGEVPASEATNRCTLEALQQFHCKCLSVVRKENGWKIKGVQLPLNPVCVFTYNFSKKSVTAITPLETEGIVRRTRNYPEYKADLWMHSRTRVTLSHLDDLGNIGKIRFIDDSKYQFNAKGTWYKNHKVDRYDTNFKPDTAVTFCLALHFNEGEAEEKAGGNRISIQTWNVKKKVEPNEYSRKRHRTGNRNRQRIRDCVIP